MDVQWANEGRPWLDLRVRFIELNGRVDEDLAAARRVLAAAANWTLASTPAMAHGEDRASTT